MGTPIYKLIPFSEIDNEARDIAVAWVEQYGTMGMDLENKHKLASDIMNYHLSKLKLSKPYRHITKGRFNIKTEDIVHQWLSIKSNRDSLPVYMVDQQLLSIYDGTASKHYFDGDVVYSIDGNYFNVIVKEE